jgi:uncharacterized protein (DUF952 family)
MLHIARPEEWQAAQVAGVYSLPSGIVHCCLASQLPIVVEAHFPDRDGWLVLTIDGSRAASPIVWVTFTDQGRSETFPHVHGEVPTAAINRVESLRDALLGMKP